MARDFSTDHGITLELSHQASPQQRTPTAQIGAVSRRNPTPTARIAVNSLARCSLVRTKRRESRSAIGSTAGRKLGRVMKM